MPYTSSDDSSGSNNQTYIYVNAFVDELQRAGVHNVVICPGSRSTPLALAIAQHPALRVWTHVDERSAAFFGLGMAKRLGLPVALLCTSGTAAANFMPAIVEAKLSHVPLLVLTADRPHELRDCGAPQAIDQNRLYGTHVKWFVEVALPEASNEALRYIRTLADRATALIQAVPVGPVHLNFPFREPLTPEPHTNPPLPTQQKWRDQSAWQGRLGNEPYIRVGDAAQNFAPKATIEYLIEKVDNTPDGLIIVGPLDKPALTEPLIELAQYLGYPILADPLSQLRCGPHDHSHIVTTYDALLHCTDFMHNMPPHFILRFGAMPTSKTLLLYLKHYHDCPQVVIDGHGNWEEPTQLADMLIHVDPVAFCQDFLRMVDYHVDRDTSQDAAFPWLTIWQQHDQLARETLRVKLQEFEPLFEGRVFNELGDLLPDGTNLFAGNSMPVRDLDSFFWGSQQHVHILGNRGASGIDGITSTALGISAASDQDEPTVLVIGDLSFFHDLNGLLAARLHQLNLTIVLANNDGGGIFSFLPQANYPEDFEQLFGTPTGLDFRPAVQMYGGQFRRIATWQEFRQAIRDSLTNDGLHVIEVPTERASNVEMHRQLWLAIEQELGGPTPRITYGPIPPSRMR
ncbi:MAG TPA: 2-succinyl-5-enolpyruvyl-6-hydroxy-3-cyclohexene-1-carboxylic-acid synthase [Ktedonobacteraceae bacterium]|nr:2-succinyl-5-enolpyruvyl-6-hydroxy-3-cyclohexene-1-carboxylic-acid synthase [Ktedonobacteraceae bacterium]